MKKALIVIAALVSMNASAEPMCHVKVCNKLERFTLSISSMIKDKLSEACFEMDLPKSQAIEGHKLSSESRWWQGSHLNPTKKSVTRVKTVYGCTAS